MLDIDDTVKPVFGAAKQGAQHGYTRVKGLNAQLATISTEQAAPVIVGARLRRGAAASAHGAVRLVRDSLTTTRRAGVTGQILVRADSAYYQHAFVTAVTKAGACFSVGARQDSAVRRAIASIDDQSWVRIEYPQAVLDPDTGELVSCAEVAEVPYLAFTSHGSKAVPGRLIVRRVPERNTKKLADAAQEGLFTVWRYHAIFTNNPAELWSPSPSTGGTRSSSRSSPTSRPGPLAHLPSGRFQANAAWLVAATIAFNLTRAHRRGRRREVHPGRGRDRASPGPERSRPGLPIRATPTPAPTPAMALGVAVAGPLDDGDDHLTAGPIPTRRPEDPGEAGPDRPGPARLPAAQPRRTAHRSSPMPLSHQRGGLRLRGRARTLSQKYLKLALIGVDDWI